MATRNQAYNPLLKSYPDSEKLNRVSIPAEAFYLRLLAQSDDAGRYWADPPIVLARLYTLRMVNGTATADDIKGWIAELRRENLIKTYRVEGRLYLELIEVFKTLRKDVKPHYVFPAEQDVTNPKRPVTNPERNEPDAGRNEPDPEEPKKQPPPLDPHHTTPHQTQVVAAEPQEGKKPAKQKPPKAPRPRDEIFDTLAQQFHLTPESETDASLIGKVMKSLKAKGATPDEIKRRIRNYQDRWPDMDCTITALDKHWATCANAPPQDPEEEGDDGEWHPIRDPKIIYDILINNP